MASANWLPIVAITSSAITTLGAPILAILFAERRNQPNPAPQPKKPKNLTQTIGDWFTRISTFTWIFPSCGIVVSICALIVELHRTTPITRTVIFIISFATVLIFWNMAFALLSLLSRYLVTLAVFQKENIGVGRDLLSLIKVLAERVELLENQTNSKN